MSKLEKLYIRRCSVSDIDDILNLQDIVIEGLDDKDLLRKNVRETFEKCVIMPNLTVGVYDGDILVAVAILLCKLTEKDDLSIGLEKHQVENSVNYKLVMVRSDYRGLGLQRKLIWIFEKYACIQGYTHFCVSVSGKNKYSLGNVEKAGFCYDHDAVLYGGLARKVLVKDIRKDVSEYNKMICDLAACIVEKQKCDDAKSNAAINISGILNETGRVDMSSYICGELSIAATGDILEYRDNASGKISYGLFVRQDKPMVLVKLSEAGWHLTEFSENIGTLSLQRVLINTVAF